MKTFKNKKIVTSMIIIVLLITGIFIHNSIKKNDDFIVGKTLNIKNYTDYLVQYDDGDYYLMKANADIKFSVESEEKEIKYTIVDEDDKEISTKVREKKKNFEIVADKNYEAGKTYKLTLENASFTEEKLKDIKTLYFTIVRPNANTQILNDDVIKVNKDTITNMEEDETHYTITSNKEFQENDILYYQSGEERLAFKVDGFTKENNNYVIKTSAPTPEEIFKELDVYGEFHLKLEDFISEEELKDYIKIAIEEEGILDKIVPNVQAASIFNIEVKTQNDGSAKVKVSLRLSGGEKSVFDNWLEEHDMKLDIEFLVKLTAHSDITLFKQDIGLKIEMELGTDFNIEPTSEDFLALKHEMKDNQEIDIAVSREKIKELKKDTTKIKKPFAKTTIYAPNIGLAIRFQASILNELEIALESSLSMKENIDINFGYNNKKGFYKNFDFETKESDFSILGKGEYKLGLEPKASISFVGIMEAGIESPVGMYGEGQINYMNSKDKNELDGNFELGAFVSAGVYAKIKFLKLDLAKVEANYEKKFPILKWERTLGGEETEQGDCEEKLLNGDFSCYAGTYTYVLGYKGSQTSKFTLDKEGKITGDGFSETYNNKPVSIQKEEDGTYRIEHQFYFETPSGENQLTSQYFYLAPIDVSLKYYSTQGTNEETDSSTIRIKKEGFIAADANVVYQKDE